MTSKTRILLMILCFVALTLGSFIWFVISWDPAQEQPVVQLSPLLQTKGGHVL